MLDELFDDVPMIGVVITWVVGMVMLLYLRSSWKGTSLDIGIAELIIFGIILLIPAYIITRYWANKD